MHRDRFNRRARHPVLRNTTLMNPLDIASHGPIIPVIVIERAQDAAEAAMEDATDAARDDIRNYGRYAIKVVA